MSNLPPPPPPMPGYTREQPPEPKKRWRIPGAGCLLVILLLLILLFIAGRTVLRAQEPVTYDEVNAVAARMYCPECENIPLNKCFTEVCVQWKQDIAEQLAAGRNSDTIVNDFVTRFGDQVVGVPQDPTLRAFTLIAPWVLGAGMAAFGWWTLSRLRTGSNASRAAQSVALSENPALDSYRQRVERDLNE